MSKYTPRTRFSGQLWDHLQPLLTLNDHKRPWGVLLTSALAVGLPVLIAVWLDQFATGILCAMGGMVILYMPQTPIPQRMITLLLCSMGFVISFTLGVLTSFDFYLSAITLGLTTFFITLICRVLAMPPPGSFFFILIVCLASTLPFELTLIVERAGTLLLGSMGACLLALGYSIAQRYFISPPAVSPARPTDHRIAAIILESAVIGLFVGGSYLFALLIGLDKPYWVPVSCAAIMQGATFRAVWHRHVHRIVGTLIGMGLAWIIFAFSPGIWTLALLVTLLTYVIELMVTRNYGLAVIFITPLTVIFADTQAASSDPHQLIITRLFDILLGCSFGYVGGWIMHHPKLFNALETQLNKWRRSSD